MLAFCAIILAFIIMIVWFVKMRYFLSAVEDDNHISFVEEPMSVKDRKIVLRYILRWKELGEISVMEFENLNRLCWNDSVLK